MYSVAEAAARLGLSEQRVRQLLKLGQLPGQLVGGRWLVDDAALQREAKHSRGMSPRMAWALVELAEGRVPEVAPSERTRLRKQLQRLREDPDGLARVRHWLAGRAERRAFAVGSADAADLLADGRVFASGVSDGHAGLSAGGEVEGYVLRSELGGLVNEFLLVKSSRPNVFLHVAGPESVLRRPMPVLAVVADLAEHAGPREMGRAEVLLRRLVQEGGTDSL